jgi:hypothetical protein
MHDAGLQSQVQVVNTYVLSVGTVTVTARASESAQAGMHDSLRVGLRVTGGAGWAACTVTKAAAALAPGPSPSHSSSSHL